MNKKPTNKRSLLTHSSAAIAIGLMAWMAGSIAIMLYQMAESKRQERKQQEAA